MVISRPRPVAELTSAQSPDIDEISVFVQHLPTRFVDSVLRFAVKAALGCPRLAHVDDLETIPLEELTDRCRRSWSSSLCVVPCSVAEGNHNGFFVSDVHFLNEVLDHVVLTLLL